MATANNVSSATITKANSVLPNTVTHIKALTQNETMASYCVLRSRDYIVIKLLNIIEQN